MSTDVQVTEDTDSIMLSTIDNPYDPFTQWDQWLNYDTVNGYNTCQYLARVTYSSNELSDIDQSIAITNAINEILKLNILGLYIIVKKGQFKDRSGDVAAV